ncbi:MAG: hypothetical protein AAF716_00655 [Cyanobacteria bacterium P01_D01_bin.1]
MTSQASTLTIFALSILGTSVGWFGVVPAAIAEIDTGDHVCYFHGADGQEHDLSALCTGFESSAATAEQQDINAEPEVDSKPTNAADELQSIPSELRSAPDDLLPTLENATRLLSAPEPAGDQ